jgi:hypothetical protein
MLPGTELIPGLGHSLVHLSQLIELSKRKVEHHWEPLNEDGKK